MIESEFLQGWKGNDEDHSLHLHLCLQEQKKFFFSTLTFTTDITFFYLTIDMVSFMSLEAHSSWKYGR